MDSIENIMQRYHELLCEPAFKEVINDYFFKCRNFIGEWSESLEKQCIIDYFFLYDQWLNKIIRTLPHIHDSDQEKLIPPEVKKKILSFNELLPVPENGVIMPSLSYPLLISSSGAEVVFPDLNKILSFDFLSKDGFNELNNILPDVLSTVQVDPELMFKEKLNEVFIPECVEKITSLISKIGVTELQACITWISTFTPIIYNENLMNTNHQNHLLRCLYVDEHEKVKKKKFNEYSAVLYKKNNELCLKIFDRQETKRVNTVVNESFPCIKQYKKFIKTLSEKKNNNELYNFLQIIFKPLSSYTSLHFSLEESLIDGTVIISVILYYNYDLKNIEVFIPANNKAIPRLCLKTYYHTPDENNNSSFLLKDDNEVAERCPGMIGNNNIQAIVDLKSAFL